MKGMSATTGESLAAVAHLRQSITDILTTPLGSRVMRRDYGSLVFELVDQAANPTGQMLLKAVCAHAIAKWEPRVLLKRIRLSEQSLSGRIALDVELEYIETGAAIGFEGLTL